MEKWAGVKTWAPLTRAKSLSPNNWAAESLKRCGVMKAELSALSWQKDYCVRSQKNLSQHTVHHTLLIMGHSLCWNHLQWPCKCQNCLINPDQVCVHHLPGKVMYTDNVCDALSKVLLGYCGSKPLCGFSDRTLACCSNNPWFESDKQVPAFNCH